MLEDAIEVRRNAERRAWVILNGRAGGGTANGPGQPHWKSTQPPPAPPTTEGHHRRSPTGVSSDKRASLCLFDPQANRRWEQELVQKIGCSFLTARMAR